MRCVTTWSVRNMHRVYRGKLYGVSYIASLKIGLLKWMKVPYPMLFLLKIFIYVQRLDMMAWTLLFHSKMDIIELGMCNLSYCFSSSLPVLMRHHHILMIYIYFSWKIAIFRFRLATDPFQYIVAHITRAHPYDIKHSKNVPPLREGHFFMILCIPKMDFFHRF